MKGNNGKQYIIFYTFSKEELSFLCLEKQFKRRYCFNIKSKSTFLIIYKNKKKKIIALTQHSKNTLNIYMTRFFRAFFLSIHNILTKSLHTNVLAALLKLRADTKTYLSFNDKIIYVHNIYKISSKYLTNDGNFENQ